MENRGLIKTMNNHFSEQHFWFWKRGFERTNPRE